VLVRYTANIKPVPTVQAVMMMMMMMMMIMMIIIIIIIILFIDCKWIDTRWQFSFNMLHMHGLWRLII